MIYAKQCWFDFWQYEVCITFIRSVGRECGLQQKWLFVVKFLLEFTTFTIFLVSTSEVSKFWINISFHTCMYSNIFIKSTFHCHICLKRFVFSSTGKMAKGRTSRRRELGQNWLIGASFCSNSPPSPLCSPGSGKKLGNPALSRGEYRKWL